MLKKIYPEKLRTRIMLLAISLVCLSTFTIAYLVERQGLDLLLQEKEQKLFTIAYAIDIQLGNDITQLPNGLNKPEQISWLNQQLSPKLEQLLRNMPEIGAGYYSKNLDAIIVYAPSLAHEDKVGLAIDPDHPGRAVMANGQPILWSGQQVRGDIMNAMVPIIRNDITLGYIWANELLDDIDAQVMRFDNSIIMVCAFGLFSSIILTSLLSHRLNSDIEVIKYGLKNLPFNLQTKLPALKGEMNEIVQGVNHLSSALGAARTINEMILDSTIDGVITVDNNGLITMLNPAAERITGYSLSIVKGQHYNTIIDDKNFKSPLLDTLQNGIDHVGVELDFPVSGKVVQLSSSTSHLKNHSGEIIGAVVIFKDISEQKQLHRIIEQTERLVAIGELMAGVAHEIRNPLTTIRGFVQYLKRDVSSSERNEYIHIILKEVDSINTVIQQLLDFAKPTKNYFSSIVLNELVQETLILIKTSLNSPSIKFELNLEATLPEIYADKSMIKQVLLNLMINACQAITGSGMITVTTGLVDNRRKQYIEIKDTGCGIEAKNQANIFTPFFTTKPSGTGLGLSIAQKIIASHYGSISINNRKEGGVIVIIELPMS